MTNPLYPSLQKLAEPSHYTSDLQIITSEAHQAQQPSKAIALIIPGFDKPFCNRVAIGAAKLGTANNFSLLLASSDGNVATEARIISQLQSLQIAGFLLIPAADDTTALNQLRKTGVPLTVIERLVEEPVHQVALDHFNTVYKGVEYLIKCGHRRIGFLGWQNSAQFIVSREAAFFKAIDDHKIPRRQVVSLLGANKNPLEAYHAAKDLIRLKKVTAIFASQRHVSRGLIQALIEEQTKIPEELSVIIYGEQEWAEFYNPALSYIKLPDYQMGEKAMELVLKQIQNLAPPPQSLLLSGRLISRESVRNITL